MSIWNHLLYNNTAVQAVQVRKNQYTSKRFETALVSIHLWTMDMEQLKETKWHSVRRQLPTKSSRLINNAAELPHQMNSPLMALILQPSSVEHWHHS